MILPLLNMMLKT